MKFVVRSGEQLLMLVISDSFCCCSCHSFSQSYFILRNPTWNSSKVEIRISFLDHCCCRHSLYFSVLKLQMSANSHMQQFQNRNLEFLLGSGEHLRNHTEHFVFDISKNKIQNSLSDPVNNVSDYFCCFSDIL